MALQNPTRSGIRAMVPSSRMISQITPAGPSPANPGQVHEASVCPARQNSGFAGPQRKDVARAAPGRGRVAGSIGHLDGPGPIVGQIRW